MGDEAKILLSPRESSCERPIRRPIAPLPARLLFLFVMFLRNGTNGESIGPQKNRAKRSTDDGVVTILDRTLHEEGFKINKIDNYNA